MKQHSLKAAGGWVLLLAAGAMILSLGGCTTARIPVTGLEVPVPDIPLPAMLRGENDLRSRPFSKAFQILHERMKLDYAYSKHKTVDWDALHAATEPAVAAAEAAHDRDAWYLALRTYLYSIPDGNVQIDPNEDLRIAAEGASAGLALARLEDGSVIICGLIPGGPADAAGIVQGATVSAWDDKPIDEALAQTSILWADAPAATPRMRARQQLDWLPRGGQGESCRVRYRNPDAREEKTTTLRYVEDDFQSLPLSRPLWEPPALLDSPIHGKVLEGGIQYIRVAAIAPTLTTPFPLRDFRNAVNTAIEAEGRGIVLDLRGTQGGDPSLAPKMLAPFVTEPTFYETPALWDGERGEFQVNAEKTVTVEPQLPAVEAPVAVLVDGYTMGPAESLARALRGCKNVRILGESGTWGSPGVPNVELILPGSYSVMYPTRARMDDQGNPAGVSDATGTGNLLPDVLVAADSHSVSALYVDRVDRVLEEALAYLSTATP